MSQHLIDPGEGWRLLEKDEEVIEGDEFLEGGVWKVSGNWRTPLFGQQSIANVYRRRVKAKQASGLLEALDKFFKDVNYESWCGTIDKDGSYVDVCLQDIEGLYRAFRTEHPAYYTPKAESLKSATVAQFRNHGGDAWRSGRLIAIAVDGTNRFFDETTRTFYAECRVSK